MSEDDPKKILTFESLGLDPRLVKAVNALGFESPTGIQAEAIPPMLAGRDVVARARTGSGKTAAFALPMLERLKDGGPGPLALVLAPTRELAIQVREAIDSFAKHLRLRTVTIYGGSSYRPQLDALRAKVPIVVGTPGRLLDHLKRGSLDLSRVEVVVLDEADEMLRMGFIEDVETLLAETPEARQVALFSATMPPPIRRVANKYLKDPLTVESDMKRGTTVDHVRQRVVIVPSRFKGQALVRYLRGEDRGATLIFSRTRVGCGEVVEVLQQAGISAEALHGDLTQAARNQVVNRLRSKRIEVVVATDVAARGLDIDHLTHVINLHLPQNPEIYTHRIGRTGRAGREGTAMTIVAPNESGKLRWMQKVLGARFEDYTLPSDMAIAKRAKDQLLLELEEPSQGAKAWVQQMMAAGADPMDIAAGALDLLAKARAIPLQSDLSDLLPYWARPQSNRSQRPGKNQRERGRPDRGQSGSPKWGGSKHKSREHFDNVNEIELFVGAGTRLGVRPADLVGALTGEAGLTGRDIGRIQITERSSFVGVSTAIATQLIEAGRTTLCVRGRDVKLTLARPNRDPDIPPDRSKKKPRDRARRSSKRAHSKGKKKG